MELLKSGEDTLLGEVRSYDELVAAVGDSSISEINIMDDIYIMSQITISRNVNIFGHSHTISGYDGKFFMITSLQYFITFLNKIYKLFYVKI